MNSGSAFMSSYLSWPDQILSIEISSNDEPGYFGLRSSMHHEGYAGHSRAIDNEIQIRTLCFKLSIPGARSLKLPIWDRTASTVRICGVTKRNMPSSFSPGRSDCILMQLAVGVDLYRSCGSIWIISLTHTFFSMNGSHQKHAACREVCRSYVSHPSLSVWVEPVYIDSISIPSFYDESVSATYCSIAFCRNFLNSFSWHYCLHIGGCKGFASVGVLPPMSGYHRRRRNTWNPWGI